MAADYDAGEITARERKAAKNQKEVAKYEADSAKNQFKQQVSNYDFANAQNRNLADIELKQNSMKNEADRFNAMRDLQNSAIGLMGSMNQAMNGSSVYNMQYMLDNRNDADNVTYWNQLQTNNNAVNNAYDEAYNANQVAKNDAAINTEKTLRDMQSGLSTNLSNINPNLYVAPGSVSKSSSKSSNKKAGASASGSTSTSGTASSSSAGTASSGSAGSSSGSSKSTNSLDLGGEGFYEANKVPQHESHLSGYITPDNSRQNANRVQSTKGSSNYFGRLMKNYKHR